MHPELSELEFELARVNALRQGLPLSKYLANRQRVEAQRDAMPDVEYRNGAMFVDGQRATPEQQAAVNTQNPYQPRPAMPVVERPYNRNDLTPDSELTDEQQREKQLFFDQHMQRQRELFGRGVGTGAPIPTIRTGEPQGIAIEQTTISAIPAAKTAGSFSAGNPVAGADAWKRGTLAKVAGNVTTRTGRVRS